MSDPSSTDARPPQVTVACVIAMLGSVFVVLAVWDRIAGLYTLDSRDALRSWLDVPLLKSSGATVSGLIVAVKAVSMVAAACATSIAVLGFQTLRRSRGARLAMTVLAVPMFLAGLAADGIFSSGVAAAVGTLWFGSARTWFQDAAGTPVGQRPDPFAARPPSQVSEPVPPPPRQEPPPHAQAPTWPSSSPPGWAPPQRSTYDVTRRPVPARPNALLTACLITWTFCAMTAVLMAASLLVLAADSRAVLDRMHDQDPQLAERGLTDHDLLVIGYVTGSVVILWSLVAAVLALLLFLGYRWAWYALLASTAGVAMLSLLGMLGFLLVLVPFAAAVVTFVLLVRPEVRGWLLSR
ncbi:MAG TPA: hypothetical protein VGK78_06275 [Nocardioides sp.]|uniref:hypothetical protein n=1 Tax=Nocardioides sp. TaxID=35761 RepID=UPI002F3F8ACC